MNPLLSIIDSINSKKSYDGWGAQLLENLAASRNQTMAELFEFRSRHQEYVQVPARCVALDPEHVHFSFADGSTLKMAPSKVRH